MEGKLSPHASTILALVDNATSLTVVHHDYNMAKDVVLALKKICSQFGFKVDKDIFGYIIESIGKKPPLAMREEFGKLGDVIIGLDFELDKENLGSDYRHDNTTRARFSKPH